ncbi:MAG: lipoyl synthase [Gammaproteobacteria bacterium CG11_big_fil_rev_8_21_14_0_20_46_22]|nr:MAG: lipoyl synthase [Gammaproteobacteria bacterium CG12_big_fil_rev_8_21_14_0_65_46_12]PIR11394.1 MAG: lipoyl synthase [Gammaproteobacteria bacterium CG11_big_fil_rev_8_21_14_0_20_46_22]
MSADDKTYLVKSGNKYKTEQGFSAIKDGVKTHRYEEKALGKKPGWLNIKLASSPEFQAVKGVVKKHRLATVCEEAKCPNISECWSAGTATFMVMGAVCTRACQFCSVDTGNPKGWLDKDEPDHCANAVKLMGLKYIVLTSVDRDDIEDGGAAHYAACVKAIKRDNPETAVEALVPDFQGSERAVDTVLASGVDVFAQNLETVKRLTHPVRDPRAGYEQTLNVLAYAKQASPNTLTKTSLMLGLGETDEEVLEAMRDIKAANVDILTLGQYLRPTKNHLPVERYVTPEQFNHFREKGLAMGFLEVVSGPLVRSSYRAEQALLKNNVGLPS